MVQGWGWACIKFGPEFLCVREIDCQGFGLQLRVPGIELKNPSSPEIRTNTKKLRNSPTLGWAPKVRKTDTKNIRKRSFSGHFRIFLYFFAISVSFFFLRISGLERFLSSIPGKIQDLVFLA